LGYHGLVLSSRNVRLVLVAFAFLSALTLRSTFTYDAVFRSEGVAFQDPDATFHVRTIQNLLRHFPYRSGSDPYSGFPRGQNIDTGPFHDYAIASLAWVAGGGSPSRQLTDGIAAWFPAVLGSLLVAPVYLLGRSLFGAGAGLIGAGLIAVLPGFFFWVTRLGNPDHHVTEVLLVTVLLLVMARALQAEAPSVRQTALAGLVLSCYFLTQTAGVLVVLCLVVWALLQIGLDHRRGTQSLAVWTVTVPPLLLGWLMLWLTGPTIWSGLMNPALLGAVVSISVAALLARVLPSARLFGVAMLGLFATGFVLKREFLLSVLATITDRSQGTAQTVGELRPLLTFLGSFSFGPAWGEFTTCWLLAPIALVYLAWRAMRENDRALLLFSVWSAVMMAASLQYIRNCYYLAPSMALLSGYAMTYLLRLDRRSERVIAGVFAGGMLLLPNLLQAHSMARSDAGPRPEWWGALNYLREQTPEPFGDPAAYDRYFPRLAEEERFPYPPTAYGILNWWDFGHWITAYARRIPVANGMQTGAGEAARYFTATDPEEAAALLRQLGARYVIADSTLPGSSFHAMITWAKRPLESYTEDFLTDNPDNPVLSVFYPAYYQSMLARLYLFDGKPQTPAGSTWVVRYDEVTTGDRRRKRIRQLQRFDKYEQALEYLREHPTANQIIAGLNPLASCVPLPALDGYYAAYSSQSKPTGPGLHLVKIFEYQH
jgi:oligosaccharyl transferase (archaeosortase A-associated)